MHYLRVIKVPRYISAHKVPCTVAMHAAGLVCAGAKLGTRRQFNGRTDAYPICLEWTEQVGRGRIFATQTKS